MNIYLVRHGETDWNKEGRLQGRKDISMNERGRQQIRKIAACFEQMSVDVDLIVSSPLERAKTTAELIADTIGYDKKKIVKDASFIERSFGDCEGMVYDPFSLTLGAEFGWEPVEMLVQRAKTGIETYADGSYENVLITAHGAILKAVMIALTNGKISYEDKSFEIKQGTILKLLYEDKNFAGFEEIVC